VNIDYFDLFEHLLVHDIVYLLHWTTLEPIDNGKLSPCWNIFRCMDNIYMYVELYTNTKDTYIVLFT